MRIHLLESCLHYRPYHRFVVRGDLRQATGDSGGGGNGKQEVKGVEIEPLPAKVPSREGPFNGYLSRLEKENLVHQALPVRYHPKVKYDPAINPGHQKPVTVTQFLQVALLVIAGIHRRIGSDRPDILFVAESECCPGTHPRQVKKGG